MISKGSRAHNHECGSSKLIELSKWHFSVSLVWFMAEILRFSPSNFRDNIDCVIKIFPSLTNTTGRANVLVICYCFYFSRIWPNFDLFASMAAFCHSTAKTILDFTISIIIPPIDRICDSVLSRFHSSPNSRYDNFSEGSENPWTIISIFRSYIFNLVLLLQEIMFSFPRIQCKVFSIESGTWYRPVVWAETFLLSVFGACSVFALHATYFLLL